MNEIIPADLLIARRTKRKVERVVEKTYREFHKIIREEERLSADEIVAIGINLFMAVTVRPMERLAADPLEMRRELAKQLALLVEAGSMEE